MTPTAGEPSEMNVSSSSVVDATKEETVTSSTVSDGGDGISSSSNSGSSNVLLVKPPPDIRAVVDRTALFVSKNGRTFEQRILNSAKGKTPKFAFLYESSPFHAYYESRITFYLNESQRQNDDEEGAREEGGEATTATSATGPEAKEVGSTAEVLKEINVTEGGDAVVALKKSKSSTIIDPISRELLQIRQRLYGTSTVEGDTTTPQQHQQPEPPPPFQLLHIVAPSTITSVQIEIIKLCAQFTAMARLIPNESTVGNTFLNTLRHREWNNSSTYGFLQPRHAHFAYYTALVDAYYHILTKGMTIPSYDTNTPKPISIQDSLHEACYRAEYARYLQEQEVKRLAGDEHFAVVATVDWHEFVVVETIDFPHDEVVQVAPPPPPPPRKVIPTAVPVLVPEEDEEQEIREDTTSEPLHIVTDYTPRVVPTATAKELSKTTLMIDPISGKPISVADLSEHMRIQLLDPKWALEKKRFQEKQRESNLLSQGDDIAKNIRRLYSSSTTSEAGAYNKSINDNEEITAKLNIPQGQEDTIKSFDQLQWPSQEMSTTVISSMDIEARQSNVLAAVPPPGTEKSEIVNALTGHKRSLQENIDGSFPTFPPTEFALSMNPKRPRTEDEAPPTTLTSSTLGVTPGMEVQPLIPLAYSTVPHSVGVPPSLEENAATEGAEEAQQQQQESFTPWVPLDTITLTIRSPDAQPVILVVEDAQKRTVKSIKEIVHQNLGGAIPVSKMQFKVGRLGMFLKDASFIGNVEGIQESETIDLIPKVRGGKR